MKTKNPNATSSAINSPSQKKTQPINSRTTGLTTAVLLLMLWIVWFLIREEKMIVMVDFFIFGLILSIVLFAFSDVIFDLLDTIIGFVSVGISMIVYVISLVFKILAKFITIGLKSWIWNLFIETSDFSDLKELHEELKDLLKELKELTNISELIKRFDKNIKNSRVSNFDSK